jgi:predicted ATPase/class 3 adenylate cyclase
VAVEGLSGTVTFLFTDVEGSTRLWEDAPEAMRSALERHDAILRTTIVAHGGRVFATGGDGFAAAFPRASDAVAAALSAQIDLTKETWPDAAPVRVRMGLHTGVAEQRGEDYFGPVLNRAARLMSAGHGAQVLMSVATQELVRDGLPQGCGLIELGEYHLRDLGRPERLCQLVHPDLQREFGRLRTLDAYPGNLPLQMSSLVGREEDIDRVGEALRMSPVVTLTGVGGVGKTRLALQVAAELLPRFRDGAWLCELQVVRDPTGVVEALAAVFRVTARPGLFLEESLIVYLRDQELLILLDNCEHLLRPVAGLVARVEAACPGVRVLATSREGLNLRGEQILVVPSLSVPEEGMKLAALSECEAVRLFSDRARAVKSDFGVDTGNAGAVGEVCRRLDGVPLAIELAAARVVAMNPAELARRLDRRFRLLTGGERVAIERHQTLRATIDWSYELLTEPQRRLLARLAVFAGGCTMEAAETVCKGDPIEGDQVLELLADLVARSLVVADHHGPDTRYRLLETIRQYGEERLAENDETERLRIRHAGYYAEFAGMVAGHMFGSDQLEWGARLSREHDNLVLAMSYAVGRGNVDLAFTLFSQVPYVGAQINDLVVFDPNPLLALPGAAEHPAYSVALGAAAFRAWDRNGDAQLALSLCDRLLAVEQHSGWGLGYVYSEQSVRGMIAQAAGATEKAVEHYLEAARRTRDLNPALAAVSLGSAGLVLAWSDPVRARRYATEGLALARQTGMPYAIAHNMQGLAQVVVATDPDEASELLTEALHLATTMGFESPSSIYTAVFVAASLQQWPAVLKAASRVLHHQIRTGAFAFIYVAAIMNLVARALAEPRPECAAVLQGTAAGMLAQLAPEIASPVRGGASDQNDVAAFVTDIRRATTQLLRDSLGADRLRGLRAQGAAIDETQACTYARAQIDEYLAQETDQT